MPTLLLSCIAQIYAQETPLHFIIDAPGRGYREFYEGIRILPPPDPKDFPDTRLSISPKSVISAVLRESTPGQVQICLTFKPTERDEVRKYLENNHEKKVLVELGDYVLPIDFKNTLPWQGTVWTQPRLIKKAQAILDSFNKRNNS